MVRTARPARDVATEADLLAAAEPIRRAVRARLAARPGPDGGATVAGGATVEDTVEDTVQETLARVWAARWRLERGTLLAYGLVVARNLVTSAERRDELRRRHRHRLAEPSPDGDPALLLVAAEERAAVATALTALREEDRRLLLEHEVQGVEARAIAAEQGVEPNTVAARLARARARLRVEHLLALRRVTLPTARCRGVLDAISLGDRRRQRALLAPEHLLGCPTCAELAEPLVSRRRSLTALAPVGLLLAVLDRLWAWVRANPAPASAAGVGAAAVAVAVLVATSGSPAEPPPPPAAAASPTPPATLTVGGVAVLPAGRVGSVARQVGRPAVARDVPVESVPADEGFWVGAGPGRRVWVQLRGDGESPVRIRAGQRASFRAQVVRAAAGAPARFGLTAGEGAAELRSTGAYLLVDPDALVLR